MTTTKKAAAAENAVDAPKGVLLMIDPALITVQEGFNVRYEYGDIEELATNIVQNGMKNPMKGFLKDGKYYLKDGHRRMKAVQLAIEKGHTIERVPFMLEQKAANEEERTLELLLYNDGKAFTMLEQSEVIRRMLNFGWKVVNIVKRTGKARGYLENLILLSNAPMRVQQWIKEDKISAHAVIQIMQALKGDEEKITAEVEEAMKNAHAAGKTKATPKHVSQKEVKAAGFGSFYKWVEELANGLSMKEDVNKSKEKVVYELLVQFENKKKVEKFIDEFFVEKKK